MTESELIVKLAQSLQGMIDNARREDIPLTASEVNGRSALSTYRQLYAQTTQR